MSDKGSRRAGRADTRRTAPPIGRGRNGVRERSPADAGRTDRRVRRTKRALREALVQLVHERGWDDVSVRDVCERADVGRSTFYVHFADKEELLVTGFEDLRNELRTEIELASDGPLAFSATLFEHARAHKALYRSLVGGRTGIAVQRGFVGMVEELVAEDLLRAGMASNEIPGVVVSYVAGAFWHVLLWWLEQRAPVSAGEIATSFRRLTLPVFRDLLRGSSSRPARSHSR